MKKILVALIMMLALVGAATATTTSLSEDAVSMDYTDTHVVEFCLFEGGVPQDVSVVIDPICKDVNDMIGCNPGDEFDPAGFTATPVEATTGADGCVDVVLATNLAQGQEGKFYYTVNGQVGESTIGSETGQVFVPEFGVLGAAAVLGLVGLYIYKKRD